jgi:hypothetical protein
MDKIIRICLGLIIILVAVLTGITTYTGYTETAYRNSITGTYSYTCTIATDASLYNVTLFIPVPADKTGNSPMVSGFSSHIVNGVPAGWDTTLFDTGKATLVKITTPAVIPPSGTSTQHPYVITISSETQSRTPIDTMNPVEKSAMFRPVQALNEIACTSQPADNSTRCFTYTTSLFADYTTAADTTVTITAGVTGKNTWKIFEPRSNEYHTGISTTMKGENHGWVIPAGVLSSGTGSYDIPAGA